VKRPVSPADLPRFSRAAFSRPPFSELHPRFLDAISRFAEWPALERYDVLAQVVPRALDVALPRFVLEEREAVRRAGGYERHVRGLGAVPTRPGNWHDFFNMSVWAHFPKTRWALNSLHVDPGAAPKDPRNGRTPAQNLATSFDETGMVVVSTSSAVLEDLSALQFKRAFWEKRDELRRSTRFWIIGHGMLESLLTPHARLAPRSIFLYLPALELPGGEEQLRFEVDRVLSERVHSWRSQHQAFHPVPALAIPGYADNDAASFYDDPSNIPFDPVSRLGVVTAHEGSLHDSVSFEPGVLHPA
jgi:Protein of unknown function (DUF3025)